MQQREPMDRSLYTIILDFRGGTYVAQVEAADGVEAVRRWAAGLAADKVVGRSSDALSRLLTENLDTHDAPVPLTGMRGAWCITALYGRSLAIANVVRTLDR